MTKQLVQDLLRRVGFAVGVGLLVALSGLYETSQFPFGQRWAYWSGLFIVGIWIGSALFQQINPALKRYPWLIRWLVFSTLLTIPMFGFVSLAQSYAGSGLTPEVYPDIFLKVWLVTAAIVAVRLPKTTDHTNASKTSTETTDLKDRELTQEKSEKLPETVLTPRLYRRLKPQLQHGALWAITAEDHYARIYTDQGDDLILIRLADAIAETEGVEGIRVHRSWWVAREGVSEIKKRTEGGTITLKNGEEVPISRRRFAEVKDAGWI